MHHYILFIPLAVLIFILILYRQKRTALNFQNNATENQPLSEDELILVAEPEFEVHALEILTQYFSGNLSQEHKLNLSSIIEHRRYLLQTNIDSLHVSEATAELLEQLQLLRNSLSASHKKGSKRQRKKIEKRQMQRIPEELLSMMDQAIFLKNPLMFFRLLYSEEATYFEYLYSILPSSADEKITHLAVKYETLTREIQRLNVLKNELDQLNQFKANHAVELKSYH